MRTTLLAASTPIIVSVLALLFGLAASAMAQADGRLFVSSEKDDQITVFDIRSLDKITAIATGERPRHMAFSKDGNRLYVAASEADAIQIVDVATLKVVESLDVGEDPEAFDLSPDGKLLFVSNEDDGVLERWSS